MVIWSGFQTMKLKVKTLNKHVWFYPEKPLSYCKKKQKKKKLAGKFFQGKWERSFVNQNVRKIFCYKKCLIRSVLIKKIITAQLSSDIFWQGFCCL